MKIAKIVHAAVVVAAASAVLLLAPSPPAAKARGRGGHVHFDNRYHRYHAAWPRGAYRSYGAYGRWPFYGGGIVAVPPPASGNVVSYPPPAVVYVAVPPRTLTCHRSRETVTVPAAAGGTQKITITRC